MTNNFDAEAARKIIYDDNVNITEPNPLKDLVQIGINIILIIAGIYGFIYFSSGIVLNSLSPEKQVAVENLISPSLKTEVIQISETEQQRLNNIKNNILKIDPDFPKTSNLDIKIIKEDMLNALCYPNGNIYITSSFYKELKTDEELTFVIAHEMAHYRHKDHLLNLRRGLSNGVVLILLSIANPDNNNVAAVVEDGLNITDLKFSRGVEEKADKYAIAVMNKLYGNTDAGVKVMNILKEKNHFNIEFISSHPNLDKRINYIKKYSN